ncbi:MAG: hypothetical protein QME81_10755 [bacterium]|nr:hypothetical protein [bacterium]
MITDFKDLKYRYILVVFTLLLTFSRVYAQPANHQSDTFPGTMVFLANLDGNWDIFWWEGDKEKAEQLTQTPYDEKSPALSPKKDKLAYTTTEGRLFILDLKTQKHIPLEMESYPGKWDNPSFSPDGQNLVCSYFDPQKQDKAELAIIDLKTLEPRFFLKQFGSQSSPSWSPKGSMIAYAYAHCSTECGRIIQEIWITDPRKRYSRQLLLTHAHCLSPSWSPDGSRIAFCADISDNFDVWMVDIESKKLVQVTSHHSLDDSPAFGPDGNRIAFISTRSGQKAVWINDLATDTLHELHPFGDKNIECKDVTWR